VLTQWSLKVFEYGFWIECESCLKAALCVCVEGSHRVVCTTHLPMVLTSHTLTTSVLCQSIQTRRCSDFTRMQTSQKTIRKLIRSLHCTYCNTGLDNFFSLWCLLADTSIGVAADCSLCSTQLVVTIIKLPVGCHYFLPGITAFSPVTIIIRRRRRKKRKFIMRT